MPNLGYDPYSQGTPLERRLSWLNKRINSQPASIRGFHGMMAGGWAGMGMGGAFGVGPGMIGGAIGAAVGGLGGEFLPELQAGASNLFGRMVENPLERTRMPTHTAHPGGMRFTGGNPYKIRGVWDPDVNAINKRLDLEGKPRVSIKNSLSQHFRKQGTHETSFKKFVTDPDAKPGPRLGWDRSSQKSWNWKMSMLDHSGKYPGDQMGQALKGEIPGLPGYKDRAGGRVSMSAPRRGGTGTMVDLFEDAADPVTAGMERVQARTASGEPPPLRRQSKKKTHFSDPSLKNRVYRWHDGRLTGRRGTFGMKGRTPWGAGIGGVVGAAAGTLLGGGVAGGVIGGALGIIGPGRLLGRPALGALKFGGRMALGTAMGAAGIATGATTWAADKSLGIAASKRTAGILGSMARAVTPVGLGSTPIGRAIAPIAGRPRLGAGLIGATLGAATVVAGLVKAAMANEPPATMLGMGGREAVYGMDANNMNTQNLALALHYRR